jgi:hypothetical protein
MVRLLISVHLATDKNARSFWDGLDGVAEDGVAQTDRIFCGIADRLKDNGAVSAHQMQSLGSRMCYLRINPKTRSLTKRHQLQSQ